MATDIQGTKDFEDRVIGADTAVLVDFWAEWCGPCRMVSPVLEELASERQGQMELVKVNIDDMPNQELASKFDILSIPTMILFQGGEPVKKWVGALPKRRLENDLAEIGL